MKKFLLAAAMLMVGASAQAETFSFNIEGHKVRVSVPRNCTSLSCISVSAPSITSKFKSNDEDEDTPSSSAKPASTTAATTTAAPAAAAPASTVTAAAPAQAAAPAPAASAAPSKVTVLPPPPVETYSTSTAPSASPVSEPAAPAPAAPAVVASAPAAAAAPAPVSPDQAANSPIGLWMSEKKEGKIRIEDCNGNLCGYAVDAKTGANGQKVLINMKPKGDKWTGRIKDTRNGGGTYDSTIALRGSDKLRVQGCAMGGMFCGGETWTRIQ